MDRSDQFRCFRAADGELLWQVQYEAVGRLDYGNSPRATPLLYEGMVYLQSAFGMLKCIDLETGAEFWSVNLIDQFGGRVQTWGVCWSPLIVDGKLIVQPGGEKGAIAALDPDTGETLWATKGEVGAYSSPIVAEFSSVKQIIAYDKTTLGGWDIETGKRLWTLKPKEENDFNVPTPIQIKDRLFLVTENNGARLYEFDDKGKIKPEPASTFKDLAPDTHTPVVVGDRIFGVSEGLFCLSSKDLKQIWLSEDDLFRQYCAIVASEDLCLVITLDAQLLLLSAKSEKYELLGKMALTEEGTEVHAHPAFVGKHMFVRVGKMLKKIKIGE